MANEFYFTGEYKSEGHQLIGSIFNGPVSFSAPHIRRTRLPVSSLVGIDPEDSGGVLDEFGGIPVAEQGKILNWNDYAKSLAFDESSARGRLIGIQSPGTCEWLLESPEYLRWSDERGLFLVRGKAGCGKSTILKFLLDRQPEAVGPSSSIALSFFFFASGTELQSSISGFFRSVLLQLLEQDEQSRSIFMKACRKVSTPGTKENRQITWHQVELESHFRKLVLDCSARRKIIIFIDALDECVDKDRHHLIAFCHNLTSQIKQKMNKTSILITCRPYPDGQIKADFQIRLEEKNEHDIQSFVDQNLRLLDEDLEDADELRRNLLKKAGGLFLWLVLIIPQIHDMSSKGLSLRRISSEILQSPQELDGVYENLLNKIENSEVRDAGALFQWICFAARPLSLGELRIAMTLHLSGSKGSLSEYENEDNPQLISSDANMRKRMIHLSRGLVDMTNVKISEDKAIVGFHHDTIRDFMLRKGLKYLDERLNGPRGLAKTAHVHQANTCLLYLSADEIRVSCNEGKVISAQKFQFLDYAVMYWLFHAVRGERDDLGEDVFWPTQALLDIWIKICNDPEHMAAKSATEGTTLMHIASEYGLENLAKRIMGTNKQQERPASSNVKLRRSGIPRPKVKGPGDTPERNSGAAKAASIPLRILQYGSNAIKSSVTRGKPRELPGAGMTLNGEGRQEGLKMRFQSMEKGRQDWVNGLTEKGNSPLHLAAEYGSLGMAMLLCEWGSVVVQPNHNNCTPVYKASRNGHLEVVNFLYEHGAGSSIHQAADNGWTPFAVASEQGHLEVVKFLFGKGAHADIHKIADDGQTPLHAACRNGHLQVVEFLFKNGADIDIRKVTNKSHTPIYVACRNGHLQVVEFLYQQGAEGDIYQETENGWTPFAVASERGRLDVLKFLHNVLKTGMGFGIHHVTKDGQTPLYAACRNGHLEAVKFLLDNGAKIDIQKVNKDGHCPLFAACCNGHLEVVKFLLEEGRGADIHQATDEGWTPAFAACINGRIKVVDFLFECGADTDINRPASLGLTPLIASSLLGHVEVVKFICEKFADTNIHQATDNGVTPFRAALECGHLEVVEFLLERGANSKTCQESSWTPFSVASERGHLDIVKLLCEKGLDIHIVTKDGQTPFYAACRNGHLEVVEFLLKQGADANTHKDQGWTPMAVASEQGHLEVVKFLCKKGVGIHSITEDGQTPFYAACRTGHLEVVKFLLTEGADIHRAMNHGYTPIFAACINGHLEVLEFLLEQGANIHQPTNHGFTPLACASEQGHLEVVKFFCENEVNINSVSKDGQTPFYAACRNGRLEVVKFLLEKGADIHRAMDHGFTPLFGACIDGHLEVLKFLLEEGAVADIHQPTDQGWTPIHAVSSQGHLELIKLLRDYGDNLEAKDTCGRTSLFLASARGCIEVVEQLLSCNADIDTKDRYGSTPLLAAARNGHVTTFACLLGSQRGPIQFEDNLGHSLLWWAKKSGNATLVAAIIQIVQMAKIEIRNTDLAVSVSPMLLNGAGRSCDVCTRFFPEGSAYHHCSICQVGNFDVCVECFEMGVGCLDESHTLAFHEPILA